MRNDYDQKWPVTLTLAFMLCVAAGIATCTVEPPPQPTRFRLGDKIAVNCTPACTKPCNLHNPEPNYGCCPKLACYFDNVWMDFRCHPPPPLLCGERHVFPRGTHP